MGVIMLSASTCLPCDAITDFSCPCQCHQRQAMGVRSARDWRGAGSGCLGNPKPAPDRLTLCYPGSSLVDSMLDICLEFSATGKLQRLQKTRYINKFYIHWTLVFILTSTHSTRYRPPLCCCLLHVYRTGLCYFYA